MASKEGRNDPPSPADFAAYLPWACSQLQAPTEVRVVKIFQNDLAILQSQSGKSPKSKSKIKVTSPAATDDDHDNEHDGDTDDVIRIHAVYDDNDNLVQVKVGENKTVHRTVWIVVRLILQFQPHLQSFTINRGLDKYGIHELAKCLPSTHITELCLDGCRLPESPYHVFLEERNFLRQLSLSRCSVNDEVVEKIAANLVYPSSASLTLRVLNLSSNKITDTGAICLANTLRSNRQLAYINLAGNMIEDKGTFALLNTLLEFPVTEEELKESKTRKMNYLKKKKAVLNDALQNLRSEELGEDRRSKKKSLKTSPVKRGKTESEVPKMIELTKVPEALILERAVVLAENALGTFSDPFLSPNSFARNGKVYCLGNNTLSYINLAYNNFSFLSLKLFLNVLVYQRVAGRKPTGLVNFCIEGNNLPVTCMEMLQIDEMLEKGLCTYSRRCSLMSRKSKQMSKTPIRTPI